LSQTEAGAIDAEAEAPTGVDAGEAAPALDFSILKGLKVNKLGKIVDDNVCSPSTIAKLYLAHTYRIGCSSWAAN